VQVIKERCYKIKCMVKDYFLSIVGVNMNNMKENLEIILLKVKGQLNIKMGQYIKVLIIILYN
jgi:hypothetical protein